MSDISKLTDKDIFRAFVILLYQGVQRLACRDDAKHIGEKGYQFSRLDMRTSWGRLSKEEREQWEFLVKQALKYVGETGETICMPIPEPD
jgi:hypothetical protein